MKITQDIAKERVKKLGMELVSEFKGTFKGSRVDVKCKCGKVFNVSWKHLSYGHTKSCGCLRKHNLVGKRFGKLIVIKEIPKKERSYKARWWLCKCDCGNFKETITASLVKGSVFTCGCSRFGENSKQWSGYKNISGSFWSSLVCSAKERKLDLKVTKEYLQKLLESQNFKCALSGVPIGIHTFKKENSASLDRIDSSKGYVEGNVQWVHKYLNSMKWDLSMEEFLEWCKKVVNHLTNIKKSDTMDEDKMTTT